MNCSTLHALSEAKVVNQSTYLKKKRYFFEIRVLVLNFGSAKAVEFRKYPIIFTYIPLNDSCRVWREVNNQTLFAAFL